MMMSILTPESKNMGKVREREKTSREVRRTEEGNTQPLVAQLLPHQLLGKNELLRRYIHKQNLKDSI